MPAPVGLVDPQAGRGQAKRRRALVLTDERYNRARGLAVVCALISKRNLYPLVLPIVIDPIEGAVLVDQLKSFDSDLATRNSIPELRLHWRRRHDHRLLFYS